VKYKEINISINNNTGNKNIKKWRNIIKNATTMYVKNKIVICAKGMAISTKILLVNPCHAEIKTSPILNPFTVSIFSLLDLF
jgi:hypothetical protein